MRTFLFFAAAAAALATASVALAEPAHQPYQQVAAVFHVQNSLGQWFWGVTPEAAMAECQVNTPYGYYCYQKGYW